MKRNLSPSMYFRNLSKKPIFQIFRISCIVFACSSPFFFCGSLSAFISIYTHNFYISPLVIVSIFGYGFWFITCFFGIVVACEKIKPLLRKVTSESFSQGLALEP